mmetsp:Transcript_83466/g.145093  ORF Transcript_83466/g.145093 Transcript_83466/m.145093 type:complete len:319 (+) Transcript_83466:102-1058(+)
MHRFAFLLVAAQSALSSAAVARHVNLRAEPATRKKAEIETFSEHLWNSTMAAFMQHEVMQHEVQMPQAEPPKYDKVMYTICCMLFGCCGCDRCYMGQMCLGWVKGLTLGGFMVWHTFDYVVCCYCALTKMKKIEMAGYNATFLPNSIDNAYWACIIFLVMNVLSQIRLFFLHKAQLKAQKETFELLNQMQRDAQQQRSVDVPAPLVRHQSLSMMPTPFARMLRKAGIVTKNATIPELVAAFQKLDKDGNGQLEPEELKEALSSMGVSDEEVDAMIKEADINGDGKINKGEFLAYYATKAAEASAAKAAEASEGKAAEA